MKLIRKSTTLSLCLLVLVLSLTNCAQRTNNIHGKRTIGGGTIIGNPGPRIPTPILEEDKKNNDIAVR